jgi:hypothetical protein
MNSVISSISFSLAVLVDREFRIGMPQLYPAVKGGNWRIPTS